MPRLVEAMQQLPQLDLIRVTYDEEELTETILDEYLIEIIRSKALWLSVRLYTAGSR